MSDARDVAVDPGAPAADRYVALWSLLTEAPEDNLDVAAAVAEEPVGEVEAWAVPLQAVALVALVPRDPERWMRALRRGGPPRRERGSSTRSKGSLRRTRGA